MTLKWPPEFNENEKCLSDSILSSFPDAIIKRHWNREYGPVLSVLIGNKHFYIDGDYYQTLPKKNINKLNHE